jgi:PST family polysaccharide transporter
MVVLARLIPPAEFGHAAIAIVVNGLTVVITFEFCATPLVQARTVTNGQLRSAVVASIGLGAVLAALMYLLGAVAAGAIFDDRTAELLQMISPAFLLGGIAAVPRAILHRRLDFLGLSMVEITSLLAGLVASVSMAVAGLDAEALVLGGLTTSVVSTIQLSLRAPLPRPAWRRAELGDLASFGLASGMSAVAGRAFRNVDFAIIGASMSATALGFYWRAFQLGVEHQGKISGVMLRIALPVYSRTANIEDMRALRRRITRLHATVILPLQAGLIALAPVLIPWLFGSRWEPAVLPTQILAGAGMFTALLTGAGPLVLAVGRPRALLAYNVASAVVYAAAIFIAAPYGLTAVCIVVVVVYAAQFACAQVFLLQRLVGIPVRELRYDAGPGTVSSAVLVAVMLGSVEAAKGLGLPDPAILVVAGSLGSAAYLLTLRRLFADAWSDVEVIGRMVLRRRDSTARAASDETPPAVPAPASVG